MSGVDIDTWWIEELVFCCSRRHDDEGVESVPTCRSDSRAVPKHQTPRTS